MTEILTALGISNGYVELMPMGQLCTKCGHSEEAHFCSHYPNGVVVYDHGHCQICTCPKFNGEI